MSKRLSIQGKSLRNRLTVVVALVFILPFLIFFHVLYEEGLILKFIYHYAIIIVPLLVLSLLGLILLRQIFDKFMLISDFMKKADSGEFVMMDIHEDAAELREISISFNNILKKFQETSKQLEEATLKLNQEISLRQIAEENFKINAERFRVVAENAADAIICLEAPDNIVLWNKKAEEMFGYKADEVMGMNLHSIIVPEKFREKTSKGLNRFFETGTGPVVGKTIELSALRKDGREFPIELSISAMNIQGKWQSAGIIRDITERKTAEKMIRESESRYKYLIDSVTGYIYTVKVENGKPVSTSHGYGCAGITGFTSDEFDAYPFLWLQMIHEHDREAVKKQAEAILSGKKVPPIEHRIICKDGRIKWIRNTPVMHYDEHGNLTAYDGLVSDITESKIAWDAVEKAKKEWEATFDAIKDPIFIHDKKFNLVRVNKAYQMAAGMAFNEIIGRSYYEVFPKMDAPLKMCQKAMELQENIVEEVFIPSIDRIFNVRFYPMKDAEGRYLYSAHVMEDITERKKLDENLRKSEANLKKAQEVAHIGSWHLDIMKNELIWSDETYRIFKVPIGTPLTYEKFLETVHPDDLEYVDKAWTAALNREPYDIEHRILVGGEMKWVREKAEVEFNEQGKTVKGTGIVQDITGTKKAEETLKASQEYINNVINSSLDMIVAVDNDRRITVFNKAAQEIFGYGADEVLGRHADILYANPDEGLKAHKMTIEHGIYVQEILNKRKNNETFPSLLSASILKDLQGNTAGVMGISHDITNRKLAEKRIMDEMEITSHILMIAEATAHTTDMDKLMQQAVICIHKVMKSDACLSYLWEEDIRRFMPVHAVGLPDEMIPRFRVEHLDEGIEFVKKAARERDAAISSAPFMGADPASKPVPWLKDFNTMVIIPLLGRKKHLGLIISIYKKPVEFNDRDKKIFKGISNQVSTAVEEAWHYKEGIDKAMELSHKIETIQVMNDIDKTILSTLNPQEILETASRMISRLVSCDRVTIALVDNEKKGFRYAAGGGDDAVIKNLAFVKFEETSASKILKTGMPEYAANLIESSNLLVVEKKLLDAGFLSHIRMPIKVRDNVVGILSVGAKRPSAFTPNDLSTLEKISIQIGVALENARLLADLENLFLGTVKSLSSAIDAKSKWTAGHSERVTEIAIKIGKGMGMDEKTLKDLEIAGLLHDIGKIGTYEYILDKPEKLSDEELNVMKMHTVKGAEILEPIKQLKDIILAVKHHHEFYDGTGYPDGLKGEDIPFFARIIGVADAIDAMGADRPYRKGKTMDEIIAELKRCSGIQFDSKVVDAFLKTAGQ
ncbi:MAG: PAS domain S-box protein [Deltaproteobacteria bacterium]|nr:PAS domain S-box protein [Deltaproteobacteria bacterium]